MRAGSRGSSDETGSSVAKKAVATGATPPSTRISLYSCWETYCCTSCHPWYGCHGSPEAVLMAVLKAVLAAELLGAAGLVEGVASMPVVRLEQAGVLTSSSASIRCRSPMLKECCGG